ncbi:MAG: hypothetical protein ACOYUB_01295 [Patescibacteria group bacterium]
MKLLKRIPLKRIFLLFSVPVISFFVLGTLNRLYLSIAELLYPFPREYRDGALIDIANQFAHGNNPYMAESALPHTYSYGFIFPYIDSLIHRFVSIDLLYIHKFVTLMCIVFILYLAWKTIYMRGSSVIMAFAAVFIISSFYTVTLRPEPLAIALGLFMFFSLFREKKITPLHAIIYGSTAAGMYYIKQYFVLFFITLVVYFVFSQSKRLLIFLISSFVVFSFLSYLMINMILPLYFPLTFINYLNMYSTHTIGHMISQTAAFSSANYVLIGIFLFETIRNILPFKFRIDTKSLDKPLVGTDNFLLQDIFFISALVSIIALSIALGQHTGTILTYYIELLPIPLTLFSLRFIQRDFKNKAYGRFVFIGTCVLLLFNYRSNLVFKQINYDNEKKSWSEIVQMINNNNPKKAYLSPQFTVESIRRDWPVMENGQTDVFFASEIYQPNQKVFKYLFPASRDVRQTLDNWKQNINKGLTDKNFSIVVIPSEYYSMINPELLRSNYKMIKTHVIPMNMGILEFWIPNTMSPDKTI